MRNLTITGRVVRNAELKIINKDNREIKICSFSIADGKEWTNKTTGEVKKEDFFKCNLFARSGFATL